ncbi:hypothetical protein F2P81_014293 [Scophthalmus maximus]|uniref:Selenoprotein F/M domain-containing protein n=1 Tax=Scophthalmus maximus TaxID=52904 RepID=A0A6A4SM00_SCOMX|nr:hypothetical protein F2P81_014293 [Scophthalmus maximus]
MSFVPVSSCSRIVLNIPDHTAAVSDRGKDEEGRVDCAAERNDTRIVMRHVSRSGRPSGRAIETVPVKELTADEISGLLDSLGFYMRSQKGEEVPEEFQHFPLRAPRDEL